MVLAHSVAGKILDGTTRPLTTASKPEIWELSTFAFEDPPSRSFYIRFISRRRANGSEHPRGPQALRRRDHSRRLRISSEPSDALAATGPGGRCRRLAQARGRSLGRLRRAPVGGEQLADLRAHAADRDPLLLERVAVAHRDRVVLERLLVDREPVRRPDLVLAAVAAADRAVVVVLDAVSGGAAPRRARAPSRPSPCPCRRAAARPPSPARAAGAGAAPCARARRRPPRRRRRS